MGNTKPIHSKFTKDKGNESKHTTTQNHQIIRKAEEEERKELQTVRKINKMAIGNSHLSIMI